MSDHPPIAVTEARTFCSPDGEFLLSVNAGVAVSDALEQATMLLGCVTRLTLDDHGNEEERIATQYLLDMSKAMVDACLAGIWAKEKQAFEAS